MDKTKKYPIVDATVKREMLQGVDGGFRREVEKLYWDWEVNNFKIEAVKKNLDLYLEHVGDHMGLLSKVLEILNMNLKKPVPYTNIVSLDDIGNSIRQVLKESKLGAPKPKQLNPSWCRQCKVDGVLEERDPDGKEKYACSGGHVWWTS